MWPVLSSRGFWYTITDVYPVVLWSQIGIRWLISCGIDSLFQFLDSSVLITFLTDVSITLVFFIQSLSDSLLQSLCLRFLSSLFPFLWVPNHRFTLFFVVTYHTRVLDPKLLPVTYCLSLLVPPLLPAGPPVDEVGRQTPHTPVFRC